MRRQIAVVAVAGMLFAGSTAWGQVQYKVTDLGYGAAYGINGSGQGNCPFSPTGIFLIGEMW